MGNSCGRLGLGGDLEDRKRDEWLHRLGDLYAAGGLTVEELDSRIQAALAATTEAELAESIAGLPVDRAVAPDPAGTPPCGEPARRLVPPRSARLAATVASLGLCGGLVAAVGQGANEVEFMVGLAVGQLGFLTHWWLTTGADRDVSTAAGREPTGPAAAPDLAEVMPDGPVGEDVPPQRDPREGTGSSSSPPRRPVGRGDGSIPTQRRGD